MTAQTLTQMQQSATSVALPGTWKLNAGRAITLQPREAGIMRIAHGTVWVTFDGPRHGAGNESGDFFYGVNEQIRIGAGQRVVVEAFGDRNTAYFTWDPVVETVASPSPSFAGVVQPLADLRLAVGLGLGAAGRLVLALAALAGDLVFGRDRESFADRAFSAQSRACRAHGAMS